MGTGTSTRSLRGDERRSLDELLDRRRPPNEMLFHNRRLAEGAG